jgi:hypothetical protein
MKKITTAHIEGRVLAYIGYAVFGVLLFWAVWFAKLKMTFTAPAFHSFSIMQYEDVAIQVNRFGAIVTQVFPLMAYKLGLPLKWILIIYSASFMLLHLAAYAYLLRRYGVKAAWLLVLSYLLFSTDLFYWTISEHQQAMIYVVLWAAWLYDRKDAPISVWAVGMNIFAFIWIIFLYPSSVFTLFFVLGFVFLHQAKRQWLWLAGLILLLLTVIWVKSRLFSNEYDAKKYESLELGWQQILTTGELLPSMRAFLRHCLSDYYWFVIVVALNIGTYLRRRQWLLAVWQLGNVVGLAIIVQLTIHDDGGKFYIDNMYLPLGFMAALPLLYDTIGDSFKKDTSYIATNYHPIIWAHAALIAFAVVRMYQVWARQDIYQARHAWLVQTVDKLKTLEGRCFIATEADVPKDILLLCTWSVGYETLLLSSYDDPNQARTLLIVPSFDRYNHLMQASENRWFGTVWGDLDTWVLPTFKKYFPLPDMQYRQVTLPLK